jgi:hypothetical protein
MTMDTVAEARAALEAVEADESLSPEQAAEALEALADFCVTAANAIRETSEIGA